MRSTLNRTLILLPFIFALFFTNGCGPGFPFVTKEQEALLKNVDTLLKDNDALKKRVISLENSSTEDPSKLKKDLEEVKSAAVEAKTALDEVRQQLQFIKGAFEEADHDRVQIKEDLKAVALNLRTAEQKISSFENSIKDFSAKTDDKKNASLGDAISALDRRVGDLESKGAKEAQSTQVAVKKDEDPQAFYQKGRQAIIDKDAEKALDIFTQFLQSFPSHKLAVNAQYWLGEAHYMKDDWEKAIVEYDNVIKNYPASDKTIAATLKQAMSFEKLGSTKEARLLHEQVIKKYPKSQEAAVARKHLKTLKRN